MQGSTPLQNDLIAQLPDDSFGRLKYELAPVVLQQGHTLFVCGVPHTHVHFPVTAVVALSSFRPDGALIRISRIGQDGVVGIPYFLVGKVSPCRGVVHTAGLAYRLPCSCLAREFNRSGPAVRVFLRYANRLMSQMAQTVICDTVGPLDQQACAICLHGAGCALAAPSEAARHVDQQVEAPSLVV